ncbi:protein of unknown function [Cupriavidus taiwanensis]|uniref:Uncharacterized protein n=1 Tax=Cupriavidus taiwanensis TaxID=164546 RepID=A0A375IL58_9BURK|nr:protein of unknown function [Cupriavidus taiwanensis]
MRGCCTSHDSVEPKGSTDRGFFRSAFAVKDHSDVPANRRWSDRQDIEVGQKILCLFDLSGWLYVHFQLWQPAL